MFMEQWIQSLRRRIQILQDRSLLRQLRHDSVHLDFSSNDYLALNQNGIVAEMLRDLVQSDDTIRSIGSTGSRLIRGHYEIFERVEAEFAAFTGTEAATLFHSGYAANTGVIPTVVDRRDIIFCDRLCHASLLDGIRLSGARRYYFEHNNLNDLEAKLKRHGGSQRNWIITESIFSMDGDSPDLRSMTRLAAAHNALIVLDDAHAVGIRGPQGAGLAAEQKVVDRIAVPVFPCGKAPGLMGAFVCGPPELKTVLINQARPFVFTTAQPPILAALLLKIIHFLRTALAEDLRRQLKSRSERLRSALKQNGFDTGQSDSHIIPVIVGAESKALGYAQYLLEQGYDVRAIRPPTVPTGTSRLRICVHADHTDEQIDQLTEHIVYARKQIG